MDMASTWAEAEFETIFREHFARMVRMTRRVLRCDAEAEEICAESFLKLYRMGPAGIAEGTAGAWLYRVASRSAVDRLRRHKRRGFEEQLDARCGDVADGLESDPLGRLVREECIAEVRFALTRLKVEKAQVLLLRHSGLTYQEVAAAMRIKPASVGTMLARAEAEFSVVYQRQQRLSKRAPRLQTANHPGDEDLSLGTPANHPSHEDLSLGTPAKEG
jgi:RNA polymerase sigma-70 factor, ECF subfamily